MSLGHQLVRNVLSSWLGYALRLAIGFSFVPYITTVLGCEKYGIWVIAFQAIGYFTLLDLGLERAVIKFTAHHAAREDWQAVRKVFSTAVTTYLVLGLSALISCFLFGWLAFEVFKGPLEIIQEGRNAFYILGIFLSIRLAFTPWTGTIVGLQRSDIVTVLDIVEEATRIGLMVLVLYFGGGLTLLAVSVLIAGILRTLGAVLWVKLNRGEIRTSRTDIETDTRKELFRYAGVSLAINFAWLIIFGSDMALLGMLASSAAAGLFAPSANIMLYLRNLINAVGTPLAPAVTSLDARKLGSAVQDGYLRGIKYVSFAATVLAVGVILFSNSFVHLWLAPEYAETATVMAILAFGTAIFLPQIIGNAVLFGLEKHKYLLLALIIEATLKLILSLTLIGRYGAVGMAVATASAQVLTCLTVYPAIMSRALEIPFARLLLTQVRFSALAVVVTVPVSLGVIFLVSPDNWQTFFFDTLSVALFGALAGYRLVLEKADRVRIFDVIFRRKSQGTSLK